jgi:hypothetical protein
MSAASRPICGRPAEVLSIFTASTGPRGTPGRPVSGLVGGGFGGAGLGGFGAGVVVGAAGVVLAGGAVATGGVECEQDAIMIAAASIVTLRQPGFRVGSRTRTVPPVSRRPPVHRPVAAPPAG